MAERWQQWMPSRLWPTRREDAEDRALNQALHDLYNGYYAESEPVKQRDYGAIAGRIRGWRWVQIRSRIFARDNYTCRYCRTKTDSPECDHIVPITRGGTNDDDNLATACFKCNRSKRCKLLSEWRPELALQA